MDRFLGEEIDFLKKKLDVKQIVIDNLKSDSHLTKKLMIALQKMIKNAFHFILKALFVLKIFIFLS